MAGFQLLGPLVAARRYAGARDWGLVQAACACGLLAGTVVCLRWRPHRLPAVAVATNSANVGERLAIPLGHLITALAARSWDDATVLMACAALIMAAAVLNLCVSNVYRLNRLPRDRGGTS